MRTIHRAGGEAQARVAEWRHVVETLLDEVTVWARERGWSVEPAIGDVHEEMLGAYEVPVLTIATTWGRLMLEPIARRVAGGDGRVDLYAWPTLFRVMLLYRASDAAWTVRTDSGIDWPQPWSKQTFYSLAEGLLRRP